MGFNRKDYHSDNPYKSGRKLVQLQFHEVAHSWKMRGNALEWTNKAFRLYFVGMRNSKPPDNEIRRGMASALHAAAANGAGRGEEPDDLYEALSFLYRRSSRRVHFPKSVGDIKWPFGQSALLTGGVPVPRCINNFFEEVRDQAKSAREIYFAIDKALPHSALESWEADFAKISRIHRDIAKYSKYLWFVDADHSIQTKAGRIEATIAGHIENFNYAVSMASDLANGNSDKAAFKAVAKVVGRLPVLGELYAKAALTFPDLAKGVVENYFERKESVLRRHGAAFPVN